MQLLYQLLPLLAGTALHAAARVPEQCIAWDECCSVSVVVGGSLLCSYIIRCHPEKEWRPSQLLQGRVCCRCQLLCGCSRCCLMRCKWLPGCCSTYTLSFTAPAALLAVPAQPARAVLQQKGKRSAIVFLTLAGPCTASLLCLVCWNNQQTRNSLWPGTQHCSSSRKHPWPAALQRPLA